MKGYFITAPNKIDTTIQLPASKSISNRALIINALSSQKGHLSHLSDCDDTSVMIQALEEMPPIIDIGAAGTAMRFLTAYLCTQASTHVITGTERMKHRPIKLLVDSLQMLGAQIEYLENEGFPPLRITGKSLQGTHISLSGNISSQYISALLLIAPVLKEGLTLHLTGEIVSRPYIDLTLKLMNEFGADAQWVNDNEICVKPKTYDSIPFFIESDWSAASYWYETAALCQDHSACIRLTDLYKDSYQGDSRISSIFKQLGVDTQFTDKGIIISKGENRVSRFSDNFSDVPDLAQTVVTTCTLLDIPFSIEGLKTLKIKETDRISALKNELKKLGFILSDTADGNILSWNGEHCAPEEAPMINTYEDHRMAMAFAPASLLLNSLIITDPQVVNKSYPTYWKDLQKAGFLLKTI